MSGHSKWSTIKRQKGAADIKRGMTFTKIANEITIATKLGGSGDPQSNPRLRAVLEHTKSVNMPKDNVQRAIDRGLGKLPGQIIEEVIFEGFGPGKVAFLLEGVTDNRMRTVSEIRNMFERSGGTLGGQGSTAYMFTQQGEIKVVGKGRGSDEEILELIDLGVEEVEEIEEEGAKKYIIYTKILELNTMSNNLTQKGYKVELVEIVYIPTIFSQVNNPDMAKKILDFARRLEEHDDIQKVYANFDLDEKLIEKSV